MLECRPCVVICVVENSVGIYNSKNDNKTFPFIQVNGGLIAVATPRELQEMDISLLLELPAWLVDECELDILSLNKEIPDPSIPPFLVIHSASDKSRIARKFAVDIKLFIYLFFQVRILNQEVHSLVSRVKAAEEQAW